jgi:predicted nucleic acid-binding protein
MPEVVVISDASPLIALSDIGYLHILQELYSKVIITDVVRAEIRAELPAWFSGVSSYDDATFRWLAASLDPGEASAIALGLNYPNALLITDERLGRKMAKQKGLRVIGVPGIVLVAKHRGVIPSGRVVLEAPVEHGFRLSPLLI